MQELKVHITSLKRKSGQQSSHQRCTPVHHKSNSTDHSGWERPQDSRSYESPYLQGHCLVVMIKEGCQWRMEVRDADIFLVCTRQPPRAKNDLTQMTSGKESTCNAGDAEDMGSMPGSGRSSGGGHANPLQYSYLESSTDKGATAKQRVRHE